MEDETEERVFYRAYASHARMARGWSAALATATVRPEHQARLLAATVALCLTLAAVQGLLLYGHRLAERARLLRALVSRALSEREGEGEPDDTTGTGTGTPGTSTLALPRGEVALYAIRGRRPTMEDRHCARTDLAGGRALLAAVFDGHGGESAAAYASARVASAEGLAGEVERAVLRGSDDIPALMARSLMALDAGLLETLRPAGDIAGSTALVAVATRGKLYVANVGDSRGVMCDEKGDAIPLSFDHKPHQMRERKRIEEAGGFVAFLGVWRVAGVLATSRALGDYPLKDRNLVIADPDVLAFDLSDHRPRFVILATDGLWDTFSNEEAIDFVKKRFDEPLHGAESLVRQSHRRGSTDNITVMIIDLKDRLKP